ANDPCGEVRGGAHLEHDASFAQHAHYDRVVGTPDSMPDAGRLERLDRLADFLGTAGLAGVHRHAQPGAAALVEQVAVVAEMERGVDGTRDVDRHHSSAVPADRLGGDDLV